jgi:hypothetical protein
MGALYRIQQQQAYLLAFRDVFQDLVVGALASILLGFLLREVKDGRTAPAASNGK